MNLRTISLKILGTLVAIAALSSLSGCVVTARTRPVRTTVYVR